MWHRRGSHCQEERRRQQKQNLSANARRCCILAGVVACVYQSSGIAEWSRHPLAFAYGPYHYGKNPDRERKKRADRATRAKILEEHLKAGLPQPQRPWGYSLANDTVNMAVKEADLQELASKPLRLSVDRYGRSIASDEQVDRRQPLSPFSDVLQSAGAPHSLEEYSARYSDMDKRVLVSVDPVEQKKIGTELQEIARVSDYRSVFTYSWEMPDGRTSAIVLVGVHPLLEGSRNFAAQAVLELEPSALLVQLCKERLGRELVMPVSHRRTLADYARSFRTGNPHRLLPEDAFLEVMRSDRRIMEEWLSRLAYPMAVEAFTDLDRNPLAPPRTLCLGDVPWEKVEAVRREEGAEALQQDPHRSNRGKHLARGLASLAGLGHKVILGLVDLDILAAVRSSLESAGARVMAARDRSDYDDWSASLASDVEVARGTWPQEDAAGMAEAALEMRWAPPGAFINEKGLQELQKRRSRLERLTRVADLVKHRKPPKDWQVAEIVGFSGPSKVPGPGGLLGPKPGHLFEDGRLEVPRDYMRQTSMEDNSFWESLRNRALALEPQANGQMELEEWYSSGIPRELLELDVDNMQAA